MKPHPNPMTSPKSVAVRVVGPQDDAGLTAGLRRIDVRAPHARRPKPAAGSPEPLFRLWLGQAG